MCAYLVCVLSVSYTVFVLILHHKSRPPLQHAMCSSVKRYACVRVKRLHMRDEDLTTICNERKKNEAGISTRAFPLESSSNNNNNDKTF